MTTQAPVDFGTDLSCTDDLDEAMAEVSGLEVVAPAIHRRLFTPRGTLWNGSEGLNYGLDLREFLNRTMTPKFVATIPGEIQNEVAKDERVLSCKATVVESSLLSMTISLSVVTGVGPFAMVLSVDKAAVQLVAFTAEAA